MRTAIPTRTAAAFLVLVAGAERARSCVPPSLATIVDKTDAFVKGLSLVQSRAERDAICAAVMTANHAALDPADPNTTFECIAPVVLRCLGPSPSARCASALESIVEDLSDACDAFDEWGCQPGICVFAEGKGTYSGESVRAERHALARAPPPTVPAADDAAACPPLTMDDLVTKADALVATLEDVEREAKPVKRAVLEDALCKRFNPTAPLDPTDLGKLKCAAPVVAACLGADADPSCAAQLAHLQGDLSSACGILETWQCAPAFCTQLEPLRATGSHPLGLATPSDGARRRLAAVAATGATADRQRAAPRFVGLGAGALLVVAVAGLLSLRPRPRAATASRDVGTIVVVAKDDAPTA